VRRGLYPVGGGERAPAAWYCRMTEDLGRRSVAQCVMAEASRKLMLGVCGVCTDARLDDS
jgi:hypothetical protein